MKKTIKGMLVTTLALSLTVSAFVMSAGAATSMTHSDKSAAHKQMVLTEKKMGHKFGSLAHKKMLAAQKMKHSTNSAAHKKMLAAQKMNHSTKSAAHKKMTTMK